MMLNCYNNNKICTLQILNVVWILRSEKKKKYVNKKSDNSILFCCSHDLNYLFSYKQLYNNKDHTSKNNG